MRWLVAAAVLGALAAMGACSVGSTGVEHLTFACASDEECADGWRCQQGACTLEGVAPPELDAGGGPVCVPSTESCDTQGDEDCDGKFDCDDEDCRGGVEECANGADDNCDALIDCADPSCELQACGEGGRSCALGECSCTGNGGASESPEQSCADGADNDCDGLSDCADPDCDGSSCAAGPTALCCDGACVDLSTHKKHCGGCGLGCTGSQTCSPVVDDAGVALSGRCGCLSSNHCPGSQQCQSRSCVCSTASDCAPAQSCVFDVEPDGGVGPGYCVHPYPDAG